MVDAGYANRKLLRLTGLDVQENQARRLLNDLDAYRTSTWRDGEDLEIVATDWMREVFRADRAHDSARISLPRSSRRSSSMRYSTIVGSLRRRPATTSMTEAVKSYVENVLPQYKLDSKDVDALNAEADSGVIDDEYNSLRHRTDGYNPDDDPTLRWSH